MWTILEPFYILLAIVTAGIACYGLILRRCAEAVQPSRLRMVELAAVLERDLASDDDREMVGFALKHAFSAWLGFAAVLVLPFAYASFLLRGRSDPGQGDQQSAMDEFFKLSFVSMLAANPLAALVVLFEMAVIILITTVLFAQEKVIRQAVLGTVQSLDRMSAAVISRRSIRAV